jgi:RimJ/RimL family protein N-acetyltransferase
MQSPEIAHHLRELQINDAEWIYHACQDSQIQRWTTVPRPYSRDHAESFVHTRGGELAAYAIVHSQSGETVGVVGIHDVSHGIASVGYWVAPWGRSRGAAADALQVLQVLIGRDTEALTIRALIGETNTASRRSAERAGFIMTGPDTTTCPDGMDQVAALRYEKSVR